RGTLFHEILEVLRLRKPRWVILENVGNFERHNAGKTWTVVRESLEELEYDVRGTVHVASGGQGLISPHHFAYPHTRERFFIVASLERLPAYPFPGRQTNLVTTLRDVTQTGRELSSGDKVETRLTSQQENCICHWNQFIKRIPDSISLPSFPIW